MKRVFLLFFTVLLFAGSVFPQYTSQPKFRGYRSSDPASCARTGERYWNTSTLAETYCTAAGTPGTWAAVGGGGMAIAAPITSATSGSVLFSDGDGNLAQDNNNFYYNADDNQLMLIAGAATDTPLSLTLASAHSADAFQIFASDGTTKLFSVDSTGNKIVTSADMGLRGGGAGNPQWGIASTYEQGNLVADANTYLGWNGASAGAFGGGSDTTIGRAGAGIIGFYGADGAAGGKIQLSESGSAPSAPAANNAIIYLVDNGAGKSQLMVLFSSGAAQQLAIQP